MDPIFKKLNYKDQSEIFVINAPGSFTPHLETMRTECSINTQVNGTSASFLLIFITSAREIEGCAMKLKNTTTADPVIWFAYPKKTSKRYTSDINRDSGGEPLGSRGFEPIRQIAIDEDWSALRFRDLEFIKTMKRDPARLISRKGFY